MFNLAVSVIAALAAATVSVNDGREPTPVSREIAAVSTSASSAPARMSPQRMMSMALVAEVNALRTDPQGYALYLEEYRDQFVGMDVYRPTGAPYRTREGVRAVDEAIAELRRRRPLPPLSVEQVLEWSALDHVADQGPRGARGHFGSNGLGPTERAARRGFGVGVGETISYGHSDPRDVVIQLIVDDNVRDRGHRRELLSERYKTVGAGCGPHAVYDHMCVIDMGI